MAAFTSSRAPSEVMTTGTRYFTHNSTSCISRSLERWTIWLTANGASASPSSAVSRCSHSSSTGAGRAFSAGKEPTMPARHCAITRSGLEMMNNGEAITGRRRRSNTAGTGILGFRSVLQQRH